MPNGVEGKRQDQPGNDQNTVTATLSSIAPAGRAARGSAASLCSSLHRAIGGRREMLERVLGQLNDDELRDTIRVLERLE